MRSNLALFDIFVLLSLSLLCAVGQDPTNKFTPLEILTGRSSEQAQVRVTRKGAIEIGGESFNLDGDSSSIVAAIKNLQLNQPKALYIEIEDSALTYGEASRIMSLLREAGLSIAMLLENPSKGDTK